MRLYGLMPSTILFISAGFAAHVHNNAAVIGFVVTGCIFWFFAEFPA